MKLAIDVGGVISKYPQQFCEFLQKFSPEEVYIITDMHDKSLVLKQLQDNNFGFIKEENVYTADYAKYGEYCKAVLLKELGIDIFIDDFIGYTVWDSRLGAAPIRLLVSPDGFKPYWHESWKCDGGDFGRRVCSVYEIKSV